MPFLAIPQLNRNSKQKDEETRNLDPHPPLRVGLSLTGRGKEGASFLNSKVQGLPLPKEV
jgi:hypothetical protein